MFCEIKFVEATVNSDTSGGYWLLDRAIFLCNPILASVAPKVPSTSPQNLLIGRSPQFMLAERAAEGCE